MSLQDHGILKEANERGSRTRKRKWIKCVAAVVTLCLIASGAVLLLQPKELPKFQPQDVHPTAAGGGMIGSDEIAKVGISNPWKLEMGIRKMPVFKNGAYSGCPLPAGMTEEEMRLKLQEISEDFGIPVDKARAYVNSGGVLPQGTVTQVNAQGEKGKIEVLADGTVNIQFTDGYQIPEQFRFDDPELTEEQLREAMEHVAEQFKDELSFSDPHVMMVDSDTGDSKARNYFYVYDVGGNNKNDILNYYFRRVYFRINGNGKVSAMEIRDYLTCAEKLGDYPLITEEEAGKRLEVGQSYCYAMIRHSGEDILSDVEKAELVYFYSPGMEILMPYYLFYVHVEDECLGEVKHYTLYYVPAVDSQYFTE